MTLRDVGFFSDVLCVRLLLQLASVVIGFVI